MGRLASEWQRFRTFSPASIEALYDLQGKDTTDLWLERLEKRQPVRDKPPTFQVTRTVQYRYQPADNARLAAFYDTPEWKAMRYEALRCYGGRCCCCGRAPSDGVILNVDHIKPIRAFWDLRLEIGNLQVLCADCNQGKGARHADDWRDQR